MNRERNTVTTSLAIILSMTVSLSAYGQADQKQLNLFEQHKDEYVQPKDPELVEVGAAHYLVIEGQSAPEGEVFSAGIGAMYSVAFTMKMSLQMQEKKYYAVSPLEGLWWADEREHGSFLEVPREQWRYKLLMRIPEYITQEHLAAAITTCEGRDETAPNEDLKLETIEEGLCVQLLHEGPYDEEQPNIERMHAFAEQEGYEVHGKHHEIYLNNPKQVPPEKLRTILRQPVRKKKVEGSRP